MSKIIKYLGRMPEIENDTFIAPGSCIIGDATIMEGASIWYNCVLRADVNKIYSRFSNIQDNTTIHADSGRGSGLPEGLPTIVGEYVTVGHNCVLHACTIEDYCLIGMGAIILDSATIGKGSIIGANTLITKGASIPPFSVVVGSPGRIIRTMDENTLEERVDQARHYYRLAQENKSSCIDTYYK